MSIHKLNILCVISTSRKRLDEKFQILISFRRNYNKTVFEADKFLMVLGFIKNNTSTK